MKFLTANLFLFSSVIGKEVAEGHCPFKPGEIKSKVKDTLDYNRIQGQWINYFDEKDLTNRFLCMSAKFMVFDENKPNELSF